MINILLYYPINLIIIIDYVYLLNCSYRGSNRMRLGEQKTHFNLLGLRLGLLLHCLEFPKFLMTHRRWRGCQGHYLLRRGV